MTAGLLISMIPTMPNRTRLEAFTRVADIRTGALVDATDDYLLALKLELDKFSARVQEELNVRIQRSLDQEIEVEQENLDEPFYDEDCPF